MEDLLAAGVLWEAENSAALDTGVTPTHIDAAGPSSSPPPPCPSSSASSAGARKVGDEGIATTPTRSVEAGPSVRPAASSTATTPGDRRASPPSSSPPSSPPPHASPAHTPSHTPSHTPTRPRSRPQTPSSPAERSLEGVSGFGRVRLFSAEAHDTFFGDNLGAAPTGPEASIALKEAALTIIAIHSFLSLLSANKLPEHGSISDHVVKVNAIVLIVLEEQAHVRRFHEFLVKVCGWRGDRFKAEEDYVELQQRARCYVAALEQSAAAVAGEIAAAAAEADELEFFATHSVRDGSPVGRAGASGAGAGHGGGHGGAGASGGAGHGGAMQGMERRDQIRPLRPMQQRVSGDDSLSDTGGAASSALSPFGSLFSTLTSPGSLLESLTSGGSSSAGPGSPLPFSGAYDSEAEDGGGGGGGRPASPASPDSSVARIVASATAAVRNVGDTDAATTASPNGDSSPSAATAAGTAAAAAAATSTPPNTPSHGKEKGESFLNRMWQQAATAATDWWLCSPGSSRGEARPSASSLPKDFEISFEDIIELEFLGSGALGTVFSGVLEGEKVAIKKFRDAKHVGEEAQDLKSLSHPNIVALRGICSQEPVYCLVMELCLHSVHDVIKGTKIGPELVCNWAKQVACGMEYLHGQNVVHRDLKTPNVLIGEDERTLKISDFGTSRQTQNMSKATAMTFCGSVAWMAPEMVRAEPCSQMVDVWSFGVVLWELLTGQQPYSGVDTAAILYRIGTGAHHLPVATTTPLAFSLLLKQCWNKEPKHRPKFRQILLHLQIVEEDSGFLETPNEVFFADQQDWKRENDDQFSKMKIEDESGPSEEDMLRKQRERELKHAEDIRRLYEERLLNASQLLVDLRTKMKEVNADAKKVRRSKSGTSGGGGVKYIVGSSSGKGGRRRRKSYTRADSSVSGLSVSAFASSSGGGGGGGGGSSSSSNSNGTAGAAGGGGLGIFDDDDDEDGNAYDVDAQDVDLGTFDDSAA